MSPKVYNEIMELLPRRLQDTFSLFYDKAVGDADIVAKLEEYIKDNPNVELKKILK